MARADRRAPLARLGSASRAFAAGFGALSVLRHRSFETGRFDLGNMVQAVWSTAHGHPLRVTNLRRRAGAAARRARRPGARAVRAALVALAEPGPAARRRRRSRSRSARCRCTGSRASTSARAAPGLGFALAYLLYPRDDVARAERVPSRRARDARAAVRVLVPRRGPARRRSRCSRCSRRCCREDIPLVVAGFGVWYALAHGRRRERRRDRGRGRRVDAASRSTSSSRTSAAAQTPFVGRYSEARAAALARSVPTLLRPRVRPRRRALPARPRPAARRALPARADRARRAARRSRSTCSRRRRRRRRSTSTTPPRSSRRSSRRPCSAARACATRWRLPVASIALAAALVGNYLLGAIPLWRELPRRRDAAGARRGRHRARPRRGARAEADPAGRRRQRDELARRAPLGARGGSSAFRTSRTRSGSPSTRRSRATPTGSRRCRRRRRSSWLRRNPRGGSSSSSDGVLVFQRVLPP